MLKVLDLFSGLGAYSLGLERTGGFKTITFCEIREYPRRILRKHWPHVPIFEDVQTLTGTILRDAGLVPDWIVAGWPCQGNSPAGTGLGMDDPRSGLWSEIVRLAGEIRPAGLLLENSSNLLNINDGRDFGRVLGDLAALGFDAEWHCLPAAAFDAPHIRDRVWIIATLANSSRSQCGWQEQRAERQRIGSSGQSLSLPDAQGERCGPRGAEPAGQQREAGVVGNCGDGYLADAYSQGLPQRPPDGRWPGGTSPDDPWDTVERGGTLAIAHSLAPVGTAIARRERHTWEPEPDVGRVAAGVANRVERIHGLGNLNPPIIPEIVGRAILAAIAQK